MEEHLCTSCGAALPRTGTYCLACDTPVPEAVRGLSVGETQVVATGRPLITIAVASVVVVALGLLGYGGVRMLRGHQDNEVSKAAENAVTLVVRAENGHAGACPGVSTTTAGDPRMQKAACLAVVGDDAGARLKRLHAVSVHRNGHDATAELRGTLVDHSGRRSFDDQVSMVEVAGLWMLQWDGKPIAAS